MNWKTELALMGGLGVAAYLAITNSGKIGSWIRSTIPGLAKDVTQTAIQTGAGLVTGSVSGAFEAGKEVGDSLGLYQAGYSVGQTQQAISQAAYSAGESLGVATQDLSSMLYGAGYSLGQATQGALSWVSSLFSPAPVTTGLTAANQSAAISAAQSYYSGGAAPSYGGASAPITESLPMSIREDIVPSTTTIIPIPVEEYMATQTGVGSDVYAAAAASNLGTKYAGWEKLQLVSGGVVPKPGFDWWGALPNKSEWAQYQAWLALQ